MLDQVATAANAVLTPYLPGLLLRWVDETPQETSREIDGTITFVDISGFTKLSERLARLGKVGAEELSEAINTCFTNLLGVAYANGGGLIKFGGDALLLLFTGDGHAVKACRAASGMRRALRDMGALNCSGARVSLRMSVGVHSGTFNFFLVGDSHRELIVAGPAASQTVLMEGTAEAGEIVISDSTAAAIPAGAVGDPKGLGWLLRREPVDLSPERVNLSVDPCSADLTGYLPVSVRNHLLADVHEPEHRRVTIAFLHFDETDELIERAGANVAANELDVLVRDVQTAAARYDVAFLASDIDRNGGKIILTSGAPVASGNDDERMLLALREIIEGKRKIPCRIGVNVGHVFVGDIGTSYRRTYTIMGDAVNLAARVMAKAQAGQILATDPVLSASRTRFETAALEPFMVKGKSKPVQAYEVGPVSGTEHAEAATIPLIGRDEEIATLQAGLDSARAGRGRLVEIIAEPGMGKSRLLEELRARAADDVVLSLGCELYQASTPYFPFQSFLRSMFGIAASATDEQAAARVTEVVAALTPQLVQWVPLVAVVCGIDGVPDTDETRQLEERFRRPRSNEVVYEILARLLRTPALIAIEDTHWMDEASADLVRYISGRIEEVPWLLTVTRRDVDQGYAAVEGPGVISMRLRPLDPDTAAALVAASTEDAPFPPHQIAALTERSGGNPLFLKELIAAARSAGLETLPDSVEALIMARIDQLAPAERNLLRRASVIGRHFPREYLSSVLDAVPGPEDAVWRRISEFLVSENGTMSFVHALIRDGAYEGLPFKLRRKLHAQVGDSIAQACRDNPDDQAELLSLHFFKAQRFGEAWRYSLVAAERAKAIYANAEAAEFFERALDAGRHLPIETSEIARVTEWLGDVRVNFGAYRDAKVAFLTARKLVADDPLDQARLMLKMAWIHGWLSKFSSALAWTRRAMNAIQGVESAAAVGQRGQLMAWYANFSVKEGKNRQAIRWCRRAIDAALPSGNKEALAQAYLALDWARAELGTLHEPENFIKALELFEELGDLPGQSAIVTNLGEVARLQGRWEDALELHERARAMFERSGNPVRQAYATYNKAEILSGQGHFEEAERLFRESWRVWQAAGFRSGICDAKASVALLLGRAGRFEDAFALFEEARAEAQAIDAQAQTLEIDTRIVECLLMRGMFERSLETAESVLDGAKALGGVSPQVPALFRLRGYALWALGDRVTAREAFLTSLEAARARGADYEIALTQGALARLGTFEGVSVSTEIEESNEVLARLGVVAVPILILPSEEPAFAPLV